MDRQNSPETDGRTQSIRRRTSSGAYVFVRALALLTLLLALPLAGPASAQERSLLDLDLEYQAAFSAYEAALDAREVVVRRWERALDEVDGARSRGDGEGWEEAQRRFRAESDELELRDRRVRETREALEEVRAAYLQALDRRRRDLEGELATAPAERQEDLRILLGDVLNKYEELEGAGVEPELQLMFLPTIAPDPRDGPEEYRQAVAFLERNVEKAERAMQEIDDEIERLQARMRDERWRQSRSDFRAGVGRYGDARPPVGSTSREREEPPVTPPDSLLAEDPPSIELRIERLEGNRRQLEAYRNQLEARARDFLRLLRITE